MTELTIYTMAYDDDSDFPSVEDLIAKFDEIHLDRGRPVGDAYEEQLEMMMLSLAFHYGVSYTIIDDDNCVFYPKELTEEAVKEVWANASGEG
jgi:hypothetical protein